MTTVADRVRVASDREENIMHRIARRFAALLACVVGPAGANTAQAQAKKSEDNVKITVKADQPADGKQVVTLSLEIAKGWHLYANPVGNPDLTSSQTTVTFTSGGKAVPAKVQYPEGKLKKEPAIGDYKIYEGTISIKATIDRNGAGPAEAEIGFQCCDENRCLLPSKVKVKVD
jgi:DsbC/DsbD-like thiol-disulfide interchange protein